MTTPRKRHQTPAARRPAPLQGLGGPATADGLGRVPPSGPPQVALPAPCAILARSVGL